MASKRKIMGSEPPKASKASINTDEMSFIEHLEDLRKHLIRGFIGVAIGIAVAFYYSDFLLNEFFLGPTRANFFVYELLRIDAIDLTLQSRKLPGQFITYFGTMFLVGAIIGSPVFFYQLWRFVAPALSSNETSGARFGATFVSFFFLLGVTFGYLILVPVALQFFATFTFTDQIRNDFDINEYFGSFTTWLLGAGFVFQLPVVSYFLSKIGLLEPVFLKKYRRHAIVGCLIISALLTPPDPFSQIILAVPMIGLYELSIIISRFANKKRAKEIRAAQDGSILNES